MGCSTFTEVYRRHAPGGKHMTPASKRVGRSLLILSDIQFWIPVGVLVGGLLVLGWLH